MVPTLPSWRRLLALATAAYGAFLGWLWWQQESLLFRPEPLPADYRFDFGADIREVAIDVPGARLSALHLQLPAPRGVVFYLHGNGGNLESWFSNHDFYRRANVDLVMIDYRGYGKSSGRVESQAQLLADVRTAWETTMAAYAGKPKVIIGRSLGSGLAALLAADVQPALTILVSPYCSMSEMAHRAYPYVPTFILRYPLDTCAAAARIGGTLLLIHGGGDTFIPPEQSREIQTRAPRAELAIVPGAGHDDVHSFEAYGDLVRSQLARL